MKLFLAVATGLAIATPAFSIDVQDIHGTWRLASATRKLVDTNEVIDAYGGPHPTGWINYGKDGRMMVVCAFEGRERPLANDKMTDADRIKLHKTFFAYAGEYEFDGKNVTHRIDTSWNEAWTGTSQVRELAFEDGRLILTTTPFKFNVDGRTSVITLVWEKHP